MIKNMKIDKTDNRETFFNDFVKKGFTEQYFTKGHKETLLIQVFNLHKARSRDRRPALMEISHKNFSSNGSLQSITICIDRKNHNPSTPFHLNVDWRSKYTTDPLLSNIVQNYPAGLNHMPIPFKNRSGQGYYKLMNNDLIVSKIMDFLKNKNIFKKFPIKSKTTTIF